MPQQNRKLYLDNKDRSYTYYVYKNGQTQAIIVRDKRKIPEGYRDGTFTVSEKI